MKKIRTAFIGSGVFAVPILQKILQSDLLDLVLVVSQPPKPSGRDQKLKNTPVVEFCMGKEIPVLLPEKIISAQDEIIEKFRPEIIIVASYGQMITEKLLKYPKYKCINFHGSILPALRGAVPVQMSILNDFKYTGVTMQIMETKLDSGAILSSRKIKIRKSMNSEELMHELSILASDMVLEDLPKWIKGKIKAKEQDHSKATYCFESDLSKEKAEIKFQTPKEKALRMIRAFYGWPVAWVNFKGKRIKIFKAEIATVSRPLDKTLNIFSLNKKLFISLIDGFLLLKEIQIEGKKRSEAKNLVNKFDSF